MVAGTLGTSQMPPEEPEESVLDSFLHECIDTETAAPANNHTALPVHYLPINNASSVLQPTVTQRQQSFRGEDEDDTIELEDLVDEDDGTGANVPDHIRRINAGLEVTGVGTLEKADQPRHMSCTLKDYQREALAWMINREKGEDEGNTAGFRGGILADEMGMGKTITMLSLLVTTRVSAEKLLDLAPPTTPVRIPRFSAEPPPRKRRRTAETVTAGTSTSTSTDIKIEPMHGQTPLPGPTPPPGSTLSMTPIPIPGQFLTTDSLPSPGTKQPFTQQPPFLSPVKPDPLKSVKVEQPDVSTPIKLEDNNQAASPQSFKTEETAPLEDGFTKEEEEELEGELRLFDELGMPLVPEARAETTLIVCPASALAQWRREI